MIDPYSITGTNYLESFRIEIPLLAIIIIIVIIIMIKHGKKK